MLWMVVSEVMDDRVGVHVDGLVQERGGKHILYLAGRD
jgi:hypothetical protein